MSLHPVSTYLRGAAHLLSAKAAFPRQHRDQTIVLENGRNYRIFRQIVVKNRPQPAQGVFRVWFHSRTSTAFTIFYSNMMIPFFLGMPGFRSKLWLVDDASGDFGGIYEWDTLEDAQRYAESFAMRFSKMRSLPGQFSAEFFPVNDPRAQTHQNYQ